MTCIVSTHSFRGGTGKSNITANLAVTLAQKGYRVGVFDTDIQSPGIHVIFNLAEAAIKYTLNDHLWGRCQIEDAAYEVYKAPDSHGAVYLVPSSINTNDIARVLREKYDANDMHNAFRNLITALSLDYLMIDTHPGLNEETLLSIAISDILVIVLRPDQQDFEGTSVTIDVARRLKVPETYLVVNKVPEGYSLADVKEKVVRAYGCQVAALLPLAIEVAQAASSEVFCLKNPTHPFSVGLQETAGLLLNSSNGSG
ncbi:MAG TPA: MinD/ParA family protein [Anaerolineae bacterium]|nr:MinD/ParA family protein [Anaerolineae bacterium]